MISASDQPLSKSGAAYASLRRRIQSGELEPGRRVTLKELAELFGMSLTPVREALNRLVSEGYAVHDPHRGTFIAAQTQERVEQIYRLRALLEPEAVRLAAQRADDAGLARMREVLDHTESAHDPLELAQLNEHFHFGLYRLSGDELLVGFIEQLWGGMPYPSQRIYLDDSKGKNSCREHHRIVEAVAAGDSEVAAAVMREHIEAGLRGALARF